MGRPPAPPPRADALLARTLPPGVPGLTIIGDLHEEFQDLVGGGTLPSPATRWFASDNDSSAAPEAECSERSS
jgi:hypothetical protein